MKNKFIALALVTLSLGTTVVSCTTNDDVTPTKENVATQFANVEMSIKTDADQKTTTAKSSVERGTLHAWISEINVVTTSNDFNYSKTHDFELVGDKTDSPTNFTLDNIAVGSNKIEVTTQTSTMEQTIVGLPGGTVEEMMIQAKEQPVYATYSGTVNPFTVTPTGSTLNNVNLTTQHGRIICAFELSQELKNLGVTALIDTYMGAIGTMGTQYTNNNMIVSEGNNGMFYWSANNTTVGNKASFIIQLMDKNGNVFETYNQSVNVVASTSVNKAFTITKTGLTSHESSQTFTAQPWVDADGNGTIGN